MLFIFLYCLLQLVWSVCFSMRYPLPYMSIHFLLHLSYASLSASLCISNKVHSLCLCVTITFRYPVSVPFLSFFTYICRYSVLLVSCSLLIQQNCILSLSLSYSLPPSALLKLNSFCCSLSFHASGLEQYIIHNLGPIADLDSSLLIHKKLRKAWC